MKSVPIWIVEDNHADAFLVEMALDRTGLPLEKTIISDGERAVKMIRECQDGNATVPDLILLDMTLPRVDGTEVLRVIREAPVFAKVGIAVLSASPVDFAGKLGVARQIQKPADLERFLQEVSRAVTDLLPRAAHS